MIRALKKTLRRFRRDEDGQMLVEFALLIPLIFTLFMTSVEMGIYSLRQMFLDRGLDMTVRQIRLNTNAAFTHDDLKIMLCDYAGFIDDCFVNLKLEMKPLDPRNFASFDAQVDCTDASQPVQPQRTFVHGQQHELMLIQACVKFRPVFPTSGLGYDMATNGDGAGMAKMVSISAFVQEPN